MTKTNDITEYVHNFLYTVSRPQMAEVLLSSINVEKLKNADVSAKLMTLGAMLHSRELNECMLLASHLDFREIPLEERSLLVLVIFTKFYEHGLANIHLANSLKHVLVAMCPEALLAHTQLNETLPQESLVRFNYSRTISPSVSGTIFYSEFTFAHGSRKCEGGYRIQKALASQGWRVSLLHGGDLQNYTSVTPKDFAVIDILLFQQITVGDICTTLSRLRPYFRKIIMIETDVWTGRSDDLFRSISDHIDYIWGFTSDWCLVDDPIFRDRCIVFPYFGGFDHLSGVINADINWDICTFNFTGSVQLYNLNRITWLLELIHRKLPIKIKITTPDVDDGLDPVQSQEMYAQAVAATHAAINLTSRGDGSRPATGRSFEVISLNRLLVQESCPVFHQYFVEGEHFLEFSDTERLCTIIDFLGSHPKTAQRLCAQGHQFYKEHYSCKKLVEHFQTIL